MNLFITVIAYLFIIINVESNDITKVYKLIMLL